MKVYVGQGSIHPNSKMAARLRAYGLGVCVCPGELPAIHDPWFFDNGAFRDYRHGRSFDGLHFSHDLSTIRRMKWRPDFVIAPDIVAQGNKSLRRSVNWLPHLRNVGPIYLAVQDGMHRERVEEVLPEFDGLFVGGTVGWKLRNADRFVRLAHAHKKPCHIGRVGPPDRVHWARSIGADSIDSSFPLWTYDRLASFVEACRAC